MKAGEVARNVTRGAFFLGLEKGIAMVSTMLYFAVMARWLGPRNYGILTIAFSIVTMATSFTGNFEIFLERYAAEYEVRGRRDLLRSAYRLALGLKLGLGALASVALVLLAPWLAARYHTPDLVTLLPLLLPFVAFDGLATTGRSMLFGLQHYEWISVFSLIFNVGKTILVGALWWFGQRLPALAIGFSSLAFVQALFICGVSLWILSRARPATDEPDRPLSPLPKGGQLRAMFAYCIPLYGARLSFLSGQNLVKLVLGLLLDVTTLGYFTLAFNTVERFTDVVNTLPQALLPSYTQIVAHEDHERMRWVLEQSFRLVQLVACGFCFGLFVYAHEIVRLVGGSLFLPTVAYLRVMALVPLARTAQQPLNMFFQAMKRPGWVFWLALVKLGGEVAGYFTLLVPFGAIGACWANFAGASFAYGGALLLTAGAEPDGASDRASAILRSLLLLAACLLASLFLERSLGSLLSLPLRILLLVPSVYGLFALRLINRYDLGKLSSLALPGAWLPRLRDRVVAGADRLARTFEDRRAA